MAKEELTPEEIDRVADSIVEVAFSSFSGKRFVLLVNDRRIAVHIYDDGPAAPQQEQTK